MYCLKNNCICDVKDLTKGSDHCGYEKTMGKIEMTCKFATQNFETIILELFDEEDYENFGYEMYLYEHNKYINNMIKLILESCYRDREVESAMEDISSIFYKRYALLKISKRKESF